MSDTVDKVVTRYGFPPRSTVLKILEDGPYVLFREFQAMQQRALLAEAAVKRLESELVRLADQHQDSLEQTTARLEEVQTELREHKNACIEPGALHCCDQYRRLKAVPAWVDQAIDAIREGDRDDAVETLRTISLTIRAFLKLPIGKEKSDA